MPTERQQDAIRRSLESENQSFPKHSISGHEKDLRVGSWKVISSSCHTTFLKCQQAYRLERAETLASSSTPSSTVHAVQAP